jgi:hypothetical protein
MKKIPMLLLVLCTTMSVFSQTSTIKWSDEIKSSHTTDHVVVAADNSGVYYKDTRYDVKLFGTSTIIVSLIKLDANLNEVYKKDFSDLKGKSFGQFITLKDKLFITAGSYDKEKGLSSYYAAPINKATGEISGDWQLLGQWQKGADESYLNFALNCHIQFGYNADSSKILLVSGMSGKEKISYEIKKIDTILNQVGKVVTISNEFEPKTFQLQDMLTISNGNTVLIGRIYQYQDGKKQKDKFLNFSNYNIRIYDSVGKQIKEINTDIAGKWLTSTKIVQEQNKNLVLAAFYSDKKDDDQISGLLIQQINPVTGEIISTSRKEINTSLVTTYEDDDTKKGKDQQDNNEKFSRYMRFRNIVYTPDSGLIILAEKYHTYTYFSSDVVGPNSIGVSGTTTYRVFETGDLMMSKIDAAGNISWLDVLPKDQEESYETSYSFGSYGPLGGDWQDMDNFFTAFTESGTYSSFGVVADSSNLYILFNDEKKNKDVLYLGQKVKTIHYFWDNDFYSVKLDELTGKYTRDFLFNNKNLPTLMPRRGYAVGKDIYIMGLQGGVLSKPKVAVAKIHINN